MTPNTSPSSWTREAGALVSAMLAGVHTYAQGRLAQPHENPNARSGILFTLQWRADGSLFSKIPTSAPWRASNDLLDGPTNHAVLQRRAWLQPALIAGSDLLALFQEHAPLLHAQCEGDATKAIIGIQATRTSNLPDAGLSLRVDMIGQTHAINPKARAFSPTDLAWRLHLLDQGTPFAPNAPLHTYTVKDNSGEPAKTWRAQRPDQALLLHAAFATPNSEEALRLIGRPGRIQQLLPAADVHQTLQQRLIEQGYL